MKKIGFYTIDKEWWGDNMFDRDSAANQNNVLDRYIVLQDLLAAHDMELHTHDRYPNPREVDAWLVMDPRPRTFEFIARNFLNPRKVIFFLHEPPVANLPGWKYLEWYQWMFKVILTWNTDLCATRPKFSHYFFPVEFDPALYPSYKASQKKNLCVMMHSNKVSDVPGELYSLRRQIVRYFEGRGDNLLDFYGYGWNDPTHPHPFTTSLYKGTTEDKRRTFSEYSFAWCIDNFLMPGYVTYDPLVAMATGTVPIYLPPPGTDAYIPKDTYINYTDFASNDELVAYLLSLAGTPEYEAYRDRGWKFLNSEAYRPFTAAKFAEDVHVAIRRVVGS